MAALLAYCWLALSSENLPSAVLTCKSMGIAYTVHCTLYWRCRTVGRHPFLPSGSPRQLAALLEVFNQTERLLEC